MRRIGIYAVLMIVAFVLWQVVAGVQPKSPFNPAAPVALTGWVSSVDWKDPQVVIHLNAIDRDGPARAWSVLAGSPATLTGKGLCKAALAAGTHVTISGYETRDKPCQRAKNAACSAGGSYIVFDGGQTIDLGYRPVGAPLVGVAGKSTLAACAGAPAKR